MAIGVESSLQIVLNVNSCQWRSLDQISLLSPSRRDDKPQGGFAQNER